MTRTKRNAVQAAKAGSSPAVPTGVLKTTINLPPDSVSALRALSADRGQTVTEIIRGAIKLEKLLHDAIKDGGKVLVEDADKKQIEVLIR